MGLTLTFAGGQVAPNRASIAALSTVVLHTCAIGSAGGIATIAITCAGAAEHGAEEG